MKTRIKNSFSSSLLTLLLTLTAATEEASAAVVTSLSGLDINGTNYDVTFHVDGASFNSLFDGNGDRIVGDGSLGKTPLFFGDFNGAKFAATRIISALGTTDIILSSTDWFFVPYGYNPTNQLILGWNDGSGQPSTDLLPAVTFNDPNNASGFVPYVSFALTSVPLPASLYLMSAGLFSIGAFNKRRSVRHKITGKS